MLGEASLGRSPKSWAVEDGQQLASREDRTKQVGSAVEWCEHRGCGQLFEELSRAGKGPQRHFPSAPASLSSSKRFPRLRYPEAPGQAFS